MNATDTKKALLIAARAYERAMRAKTCGEAANNLRIGQKWFQIGHASVRKKYETLSPKHWAPEWQEVYRLDGMLPNVEGNAHTNRLQRCGITQMQHEQQYWEDRARSEGAADRARARHERKRPKARR